MAEWDASTETIERIRNSILPIHTTESLQQVLMEDFPNDCANLPIAGGWGYTEAEAIIFVRKEFASETDARDFVSLEYHIAQKIFYEELIVFRPKDSRFSGIEMKLDIQYLKASVDGHRTYDVLKFTVTCWSDWHWKQLKKEWEENSLGEQDFDKLAYHTAKRAASQISYERDLWFDITDLL